MNIIAVDYGTKNIGLAKWNSDVDVILPFGVVHNLIELVDLIKKENFEKIVVGMPYSAEDSSVENKNVVRVKDFINKLEDKINISVETVDERFSSQQADRMGDGVSRDEKSAMIILESYLQTIK
jgi:putative transcription antitermination factor YqgF